MNNLEIDIYLNQMKKFFENNPTNLVELIGNLDKENFYANIRKVAIKNFEENEDATLTKDQMLKIVVDMYNEAKQESKSTSSLEKVFEEFYFGKICLN